MKNIEKFIKKLFKTIKWIIFGSQNSSTSNNQKNNSIVNPNLLNEIQNHIFENGFCTFKLKGFADEITIEGFSVPDSFKDSQSLRLLKKTQIRNSISDAEYSL